MSLIVKQLHDLSEEEISVAASSPCSGVFYSRILLKMWKDLFQWEDIVLSTNTASLFGFIKRTSMGSLFYSLPFGWYGGILGEAPTMADTQAIFAWLEKRSFLQENIVQFPGDGEMQPKYRERYQRREMSTHIIDLRDDSRFSENTRRNIKKAANSGTSLMQCERRHLPRFLALLREQVARTRERRRLSEKFYEELFLESCRNGQSLFATGAEVQGELCAVHLYFCNGMDIFYFDGVASDKGNEMGANFLIFDEMIARNREEGRLRLNLGATPAGDAGLERFKSGWGAKKVSYYEYSRRSLLKQGIDFMVRR